MEGGKGGGVLVVHTEKHHHHRDGHRESLLERVCHMKLNELKFDSPPSSLEEEQDFYIKVVSCLRREGKERERERVLFCESVCLSSCQKKEDGSYLFFDERVFSFSYSHSFILAPVDINLLETYSF